MLMNVCLFVFALLLSVVGWGHVVQGDCPAELSWALFERSGSCYQFVGEERTWVAARAFCRARGGKMVTVDSSDVQVWLSARINELGWTNNGVWIGLNDRHTEGSYGWDGYNDTETTSSFSFWNTGEPSGGAGLFEQDCVYMRRQYGWRWVDVECSLNIFRAYNFICQYPSISRQSAPAHYSTSDPVATFATTSRNMGVDSVAASATTNSPSPPSMRSTANESSPIKDAEDAVSDFTRFTAPAAHSYEPTNAAAAGGALKTYNDRDFEEKQDGTSHGAYVSLVAGVGVGLLAVTLLAAGVIVLIWQIRWRKSLRMRGRSSSAVVGMDNPVYLQDPASSSIGRGFQGHAVTLGA